MDGVMNVCNETEVDRRFAEKIDKLERQIATSIRELEQNYPHGEIESSIIATDDSSIFCSGLPKHWRENRPFKTRFIVFCLQPIPDYTKVFVMVGNSHNCCADVRNNMALMHDQIAYFNDFRFVGRSGRGRQFHLTITICTQTRRVAIVKDVVKITKDGKRNKRKAKAISLIENDASAKCLLPKRRSLAMERSVIEYANTNNDQRIGVSAIQSTVIGEYNIRSMNECVFSGFITTPTSIYSGRWTIPYRMQTYVEAADIMNNFVAASNFHPSGHSFDLLLCTLHPHQVGITQINTLPFFQLIL